MLRAFLFLAVMLAAFQTPAAQADASKVGPIIEDGLRRIAERLPRDETTFNLCTRYNARALQMYGELTAAGRRAEAMTLISEDLQGRFETSKLYVCGAYFLAAHLDALNARGPGSDELAAVAVAINWASVNAAPFDDAWAGSAMFASAAASNLFGMPIETTEPVFCIAARAGAAEAEAVLDAWPRRPACREAPADAPPAPPPPGGETAPATVTLASVIPLAPAPTAVAAEEPEPAPVEAAPAEPAEPQPPPPAVDAAWRTPPPQPAPRPVDAPRAGLTGCQVFPTAYWAETGQLVLVEDVFCKDGTGKFVKAASAFTIKAEEAQPGDAQPGE